MPTADECITLQVSVPLADVMHACSHSSAVASTGCIQMSCFRRQWLTETFRVGTKLQIEHR